MELAINISRQAGSSQLDEKFQNWMAQSFPPNIHVPDNREPKKMMREELHKYAAEDMFDDLFCELHSYSSAELSSIIYKQVVPSGNSLLHVAASHGSENVTRLLLQHFPLLLERVNFLKDTALHSAARGGQLRTTTVLIKKEEGNGGATNLVSFMEMKNDRENTALHDAVINGHQEVAHFLVREHWKLSCMENNEHKSPLYLAVENIVNDKQRDDKMLASLLCAIPDTVDLLTMLEGKSPVHNAVEGRKNNILRQIANKKPELLRRKDEKGSNALHCAASMGRVIETQFLYDKYLDGAIEQNMEGNLPIHVASKKGYVQVVDFYASKWIEPTEFLNSKGQNILHAAAESERFQMVQHILKNNKFGALVNEKDLDGNTPLHLASKNGQSIATYNLVCHKMVKKKLLNRDNLTPYHIAEKQSKIVEAEHAGEPLPNGKENQVDQNDDKNEGKQKSKRKLNYYAVMMTLSILHFHAGPAKRSKVEYFRVQGKPLPREEIKTRVEVLLVVAVLIASVTFAGALQLPKSGSNSDSTSANMTITANMSRSNKTTGGFENNKGISAKNEGIIRNVYIYFDLIALNAAVMAAIILCWAQLYDTKVATLIVWLASILIGGAIYLMCLAFMFAVAIDVGENFAFFFVAILVGGGFFLVQTVVSAPLIIPPSANKIIENLVSPLIYYSIFICYLCFEWLLCKFSNQNMKKTEATTNIHTLNS